MVRKSLGNLLLGGHLLALTVLTVSCAADDSRLVGRWAEVNSLDCPGYQEVAAEHEISMLRFNENGDFAMSYKDGQLIYRGTYEAKAAAEAAEGGELELKIEQGVYDQAKVKLKGRYVVEENYLKLYDIWLDNGSEKNYCGHSFKRR